MFRLVFAASMLVTLRAQASTCAISEGTTTPGNPPLGCPLVIYQQIYVEPPVIQAQRGDTTVVLTTTMTTEDATLDVHYTNYACDGSISEDYTRSEAYTRYTIQLVDAEVGDQLIAPAIYGAVVQPTGTCPAETAPPEQYCTGLNSGYPCEEGSGSGSDQIPPPDSDHSDDDTGCNAGSGSSGLGLVLALGFVAVRRRRRV